MRSFATVLVAFVAAAAAQTPGYIALNTPGNMEAVPACKPFQLVWTPAPGFTGPVTFQMIGGPTQQTLVPIGGLFGSVDSSVASFSWDVPCDAGAEALYGLKIMQVADNAIFQFSMPFTIIPFEGSTTTPAETSTTASATEIETETTEVETDIETTSTTEAPETTPVTSSTFSMTTLMTYTTENTTVATSEPTSSSEPTIPETTEAAVPTVPADNGTTTAPTALPTAGASRLAGGSFAIMAVAVAFLAL